MNNKKERAIVGVDPGTTSAVAMLDLRGKLLKLESGKNLATEDIIHSVIETGKPILMATDKEDVPSNVEEISSNFKAMTFSPEQDLSIEKKKELTEEHEPDNLHERDALAAAIYAFNTYQNKFRNIEKKTDDLNISNLTPEIKELVITEEAKNISDAIEKVLKPESDEKDIEKDSEDYKLSEKELRSKIENYRRNLLKERKDKEKISKHNEKLKKDLEGLENKVERLEREKRDIESKRKDDILEREEIRKKDRKISSEEGEINRLKGELEDKEEKIEKLEKFEELRKKGKIPARELDSLTEPELKKSNRKFSLDKSIVLIKKSEGGSDRGRELLKEMGVRAVIGDFDEEFADEVISDGIWVVSPEKIDLEEDDGVKYIDSKDLDQFKNADKGSFLSWLGRYRNRDV